MTGAGAASADDAARLRGIALMVLATICFASMQGSIRHLTMDGALHPLEVVFFRNLFGLLVVAPWIIRYGWTPLRTRNFRLHAFRGVLNLASMTCFFTALSMAPLVDVAALTFSSPIFATVFAVFIFGELVGARRWAAIAVGFAGTLVVLRPGIESVGTGPLLALSSAIIWAAALMIIKTLLRTESSVTITIYMIVLLAPMSLVPALFVWQWPSGPQFIWLIAIGTIGTAGHLLLNEALKLAETNVIMPIDFVRLIWVSIIGYVAFAEVPDLFTWIGGAMIFFSAVYIAYREGRRRRTAPDSSE